MDEEGGLYNPDRYRNTTPIMNLQQSPGLPQVSQPISMTELNDTERSEHSPGRISVATVDTWPGFSDYQPTSRLRATEAQAERNERLRNGAMGLLAMTDIRFRSRYPVQIVCPHCLMDVVTMIIPKRGATVYCGCVLMTFIGLCCVPFLLPSMQDIQHFCPHCSKLIGTNTPM